MPDDNVKMHFRLWLSGRCAPAAGVEFNLLVGSEDQIMVKLVWIKQQSDSNQTWPERTVEREALSSSTCGKGISHTGVYIRRYVGGQVHL